MKLENIKRAQELIREREEIEGYAKSSLVIRINTVHVCDEKLKSLVRSFYEDRLLEINQEIETL